MKDTSSDHSSVQNQLRVIEDTVDETRLETNEENTVTTNDMECISVKKNKRRLFPLKENSQLCSITPIEEDKCIVEESTSTKENKKMERKKRPKKKSIDFKSDTNSIKKRNIAREETWSDNDHDILKNKIKKYKKDKKDKKIQKPRKVISKKIVIKKFADENTLNILKRNRQEDESLENRDSLDDFAKHRTIPTQWNIYKSKKIVIAMTGLSKG